MATSSKQAKKKSIRKTTGETKASKQESSYEKPQLNTSSESRLPGRSKYIVPALIVLAILAVYLTGKGLLVAMVNGRPITRLNLFHEMEQQIGKQALDSLITRALIKQEARKQGVTMTNDEVAQKISSIEELVQKQGQTLDDALAYQGMTRDDLNSQLEIQLLIEKLVEEPTVTDEEIDTFMENQKDYMDENADEAQARSDATDYLKQQKQSEAAE